MAKSFKSSKPIDKLSGIAPAAPVATDEVSIAAGELNKTEDATKRKVGRPRTKTEPTKTINIAVPVSVLTKLDTVKLCYGNNLTLYVNKLIEKDIEANYDSYLHIADSLSRFE